MTDGDEEREVEAKKGKERRKGETGKARRADGKVRRRG